MSDQTTTAIETSGPNLDIPFEPIKLAAMWREAAVQLLGQGEATAAGAFLGCARMLEAWIKFEGNNVAMCMPRSYLRLIHQAHEFDHTDKDSWKALARAAHEFKTEGAA